MSNIIDLNAHRQLRRLQQKLDEANNRIQQARIIWSELTEEERKDPNILCRMTQSLQSAITTKGKALYAIVRIKERINSGI